jgi:hypothetical protein
VIDNQRQIDLLRYCRAHLHDKNLISDEEYTWLLVEENHGGVSRLEKYDALRARLATVEGELYVAKKRAEPFDRCVAAFAKTWKVGLGWDSDEKTAFLKTKEQLDNAIREAAKAQLDGEHNV